MGQEREERAPSRTLGTSGGTGGRTGSAKGEESAAILVIGNEILSGKVEEANVAVLAKELRTIGIVLRRVVVVLDDVDTIAREVTELAREHDWLFTSGGVGPTHDDVTIEAVAKAFGVAVVSDPDLETMIRAHYSSRATPAKS